MCTQAYPMLLLIATKETNVFFNPLYFLMLSQGVYTEYTQFTAVLEAKWLQVLEARWLQDLTLTQQQFSIHFIQI